MTFPKRYKRILNYKIEGSAEELFFATKKFVFQQIKLASTSKNHRDVPFSSFNQALRMFTLPHGRYKQTKEIYSGGLNRKRGKWKNMSEIKSIASKMFYSLSIL